jgi:replicative DNA helicase
MATLDTKLDRGLPASSDAEKTILGAIMLDNQSCNEAAEKLVADDFYLDSHRRIFARMLELNERGAAIDIVTLSEELARKKELESVGGAGYVSSLIDGVPHQPSIEEYVKIVKDKSLLRKLIHASNRAISMALEGTETAEEIIDSAETDVFKIAEDRIGKGFVNVRDIFQSSFGSLDSLYSRGQRITGLETHFERLDEMTSGLQPADLVIVAARPSMGKTAFAINIAENASVMDNKTVAVFSLEMSAASLLQRMLCSQARVDSHRFRTGYLGRDEFNKIEQALDSLMSAPIFVDDTPGISLSEMRAKARRLQQSQGKIDLIVVDYLQLMAASAPGSGKRYENRTQEVSAISRGLKALAKEMSVPVVALSQLSRAPEQRTGNNKPQLSDLRESGAIEQDADVVMFIYREEYYKPDDPDLEGVAEVIIAKQRNGPTGTAKMAFIKKSTRFENLAGGDPGAGEQY